MRRVVTIGSLVGVLLLAFMVSLSIGAAPQPDPVPDPTPPPSDPPSDDPDPPKYNATGTWKNTKTLIWGDCPRSYIPTSTSTAEIIQFGSSFSYDSIALDTSDSTGSINGDHYRLVRIDEWGDNITAYLFDFKLESSSFGNGYFNVVTENYESGPCTYVYSMQLIKQDVCTPTETRMCLQDGRFSVRVTWEDEHGNVILDGTNNDCERCIGWAIKERYRTMRGYKRVQSALNVSRLIAFAGNHIARGLNLADLIA